MLAVDLSKMTPPIPHDEKTPSGTGFRWFGLDVLRGLIVALMALDHASFFIARMHSREFWGTALPHYDTALPFLMRLASHMCAPGFFFLMGASMALMTAARLRSGWSRAQLTRHFMIRGALLIALQVWVVNPAWGLAFVYGVPGSFTSRGGALPGGGEGIAIYFGVLFALGAAMMVWSAALRWRWHWQLALSLAAILVTQWATPGPQALETLYPEWIRLLLIPGRTGHVTVFYPVLPWLGVAGLGILFGRWLEHPSAQGAAFLRIGQIGGLLLVFFLLMRSLGGAGNFHPPAPGWIGFFNVTKYPPSVVFLMMTLGMNGVLLFGLGSQATGRERLLKPLLVYGRSPLFFYLTHLYLYGFMGWLVPAGVSEVTMLVFWIAGLVVLYPLCQIYYRFKQSRPITSLWRYF